MIEESAIEFEGEDVNEEEIVDEFKRFLDRVSAEDFAEAEVEETTTPPSVCSGRLWTSCRRIGAVPFVSCARSSGSVDRRGTEERTPPGWGPGSSSAVRVPE